MAPRPIASLNVTETAMSRIMAMIAPTSKKLTAKVHTAKEQEQLKAEGREKDIIKSEKQAYAKTTENYQMFFAEMRKARDAAAPAGRPRVEVADVLKASIGKPVSELQQSYVELAVTEGENPVIERVALPVLNKYASEVAHPWHSFAERYLVANNIRFVKREKSGRGKAATILESYTWPTPEEAVEEASEANAQAEGQQEAA